MDMNPTTISPRAIGALRIEYQAAFRRWSSALARLQSLQRQSSPDGSAVTDAEEQIQDAESTYWKRRNSLADRMIADHLRSTP